MDAVLLGVFPVFALIALGWGLKKTGFLGPEQWRPVERLTYFVFYPGFLIPTIWSAEFSGLSAGAVGLATTSAAVLVSIITVAMRPLIPLPGPAFTSVFQGVIRWNSFVFLPVAAAVFGQEGLALAAVAVGALIPVINVACVLVLSRWGEGQGTSLRMVLRALWVNPILWACAIGIALNLMGVPRLELIVAPIQLLGAGALALGLILAGVGLSFRASIDRPMTIAMVSAFKLIALPVLMWWLAGAFGGDALARGVTLLCGAAPGAAASYVLARHMGGDASLMSGIVAATTIASAVTIPLLLIGFGYS